MAKKSAVNLEITNNADGFSIGGGTTKRTFTISGADVNIVGSGSATITFPTATGTLATLALEENIPLVLDQTLSADGKYSGIVEAGTAGETIAFGDLCYFKAADSEWYLADADAVATAGDVDLGMCVLASTDGNATTMLRWGKIRADAAFPSMTISAPVYISTTAGDVTSTQPSGTDDVIRAIGSARTADVLFFNPDNFYITHI